MMDMLLENFLAVLERNKTALTSQQYRTLKGAAEAGDVNGAYKGFQKLMSRRKNNGKHNKRNANNRHK